jgi:chorismate-pyruvate lyase
MIVTAKTGRVPLHLETKVEPDKENDRTTLPPQVEARNHRAIKLCNSQSAQRFILVHAATMCGWAGLIRLFGRASELDFVMGTSRR